MPLLSMIGLCCDKTTEDSEDEVYLLVVGKHSNGSSFGYRLPDSTRHWDMNDGDGDHNHCINNITLANFIVNDNEAVDIVIALMEEDGGTSKPFTEIISGILSAMPDPIAAGIGAVIGIIGAFLPIENSDDFIGSFGVTIRRNNGQLSTEWRSLDRVASTIPGSHGKHSYEFRMNGDGSNYVGWYRVDA